MRIYEIEKDTGRKKLIQIECDFIGCTESIKPNPDIEYSGWTKNGQYNGVDDYLIWDYCPKHSIKNR